MRFPLRPTATCVLVLSVAMLPPLAHAQLQTSITGTASVSTGTSVAASANVSASSSANVSAEPLLITAKSARAELGASAAQDSTTNDETAAVSSRDSLKTKADLLANEDARVSSVTLSSQNVAVTYHEPARLFGFVSISVPVTVSVDANGAVRVNYPWYSFLFSTDQPGLTIRAKAAVANTLASSTAHTGTDATLTIAEQAKLLDSIHAVLADNAEVRGTASAFVQ